ncbi:MAG: T9SS type A sorting domain-containing protein, partial [Chlorobi bacterium]|nr:T9SS type A sorting domain-containing protein [Chlorobiota bacterium]
DIVTINVNNLSKGVYFFSFYTQEGEFIKKIVIR